MYKFISNKNLYGTLVTIEYESNILLTTFVNYSENWFDINQTKDYWFSRLIFQNLNFDEKIFPTRTEYYLDGIKINKISDLKKWINEINQLIYINFPNLITFIDSNKKIDYYFYL